MVVLLAEREALTLSRDWRIRPHATRGAPGVRRTHGGGAGRTRACAARTARGALQHMKGLTIRRVRKRSSCPGWAGRTRERSALETRTVLQARHWGRAWAAPCACRPQGAKCPPRRPFPGRRVTVRAQLTEPGSASCAPCTAEDRAVDGGGGRSRARAASTRPDRMSTTRADTCACRAQSRRIPPPRTLGGAERTRARAAPGLRAAPGRHPPYVGAEDL